MDSVNGETPSGENPGVLNSGILRGRKLYEIRKLLRLTQEDLATIIGLNANNEGEISKMEVGKRKISDKRALKIVEMLNQKYDQFNVYIELFDDDVCFREFVEIISKPKGTVIKKTLNNLPDNPFKIFGIDKCIEQLFNNFFNDTDSKALNVTGLGGVGKSALVIEVAKRYGKLGYFDAIICHGTQIGIFTKSGNSNREDVFSFEELIKTIIKVLDPQLLGHMPSKNDQIKIVNSFISNRKILLIIDGLDSTDDIQLNEFINSIKYPSRVIITSRRYIKHGNVIHLSELSYNDTIDLIKYICYFKKIELSEQEQNYIASESGGNKFAINCMMREIQLNNLNIYNLIDHIHDEKFYPFINYIFKHSYSQLSEISKQIISTIAILPVNTSGTFLKESNDIAYYEARESLLQLVGYGFISIIENNNDNCYLTSHTYGISNLAKNFMIYQKEYDYLIIKEKIINYIINKIIFNMSFYLFDGNSNILQKFIDSNEELLSWAMDDLNKMDEIKECKNSVPGIVFPKGVIEKLKENSSPAISIKVRNGKKTIERLP